MTNARVAKKRNAREQRLVDERNALLDVLNAVMNMAADPKSGLLAIPLENYLGKPRNPVYVLPTPQGVVLKIDRDLIVSDENISMFVTPEVSEMPAPKRSIGNALARAFGGG